MLAHEAYGVGVVHHDQRVVLVSEVADALQVRDIPVHGEHAVGGDELDPAALSLLQLGVEVVHIVVLIAEPLGLAETDAVDDGGVVELVGDDGVLGPQDGLEEAAVGVEAGGVEDGVLHAHEPGDPRFQLLVDVLGAADEPDGGEAEAPLVVGGLGGGDEVRVVGEAQVVVGAHVHHALSQRGVDAALLGGHDDPLVLVGARFPDGGKLVLIVFVCLLHVSLLSCYLVQSRTTFPELPECMAAKPFSKSVYLNRWVMTGVRSSPPCTM